MFAATGFTGEFGIDAEISLTLGTFELNLAGHELSLSESAGRDLVLLWKNFSAE